MGRMNNIADTISKRCIRIYCSNMYEVHNAGIDC